MSVHFIEPYDVLFLRGNKLFGDAGSYGESMMPPKPSVVAGALRSALLAHKGIDPARFAAGEVNDAELGTPREPGPFRITSFCLARAVPGRSPRVEALFALPADVVVSESEDGRVVRRIEPVSPTNEILSSSATLHLPVLAEAQRGKPASGHLLSTAGWQAYLAGDAIPADTLVHSSGLWETEARIGIALDPIRRSVGDGQLFTTEAVALRKTEHSKQPPSANDPGDAGFVVEIVGAAIPAKMTLRLGGDGRAAVCRCIDDVFPKPDYDAIARAGRCRLVLTTPGIFERGWLPTGTDGGSNFDLHDVRGRIVCAAVPRAEILSGFDLAKRMPKPAQRAAPVGSVYWLDDLRATADGLRNLVATGLWSEAAENPSRRAEGFNRLTLAAYATE